MTDYCRNQLTIECSPSMMEDILTNGTQEPVIYNNIVPNENYFGYEHFFEHEEQTEMNEYGDVAVFDKIGSVEMPNLLNQGQNDAYYYYNTSMRRDGCSMTWDFTTLHNPTIRGTAMIADWLNINHKGQDDWWITHSFYHIGENYQGVVIMSPMLPNGMISNTNKFKSFLYAEAGEDDIYTTMETVTETPRLLMPNSFKSSISRGLQAKPTTERFAIFDNHKDYFDSINNPEYPLLPLTSLDGTGMV